MYQVSAYGQAKKLFHVKTSEITVEFFKMYK